MASLGENGQKINVHFSKGSRKFVKRAIGKTRCEHNAVKSDFSVKMLAAHFFKCFMRKRI
jgi:hypothetical protein